MFLEFRQLFMRGTYEYCTVLVIENLGVAVSCRKLFLRARSGVITRAAARATARRQQSKQ